MYKKSISREMFNFLTEHITKIEKDKEILIKEHYTENAEENMEIKAFFKNYLQTIVDYLNTVKIVKGNDNECPFVIINSIVEVQDVEDKDIYQYHIVLPYTKNTGMSIDYATCLSPLGKELLLKIVNQQVNIQIPAGTLNYVIKSIKIPEQPIFKYNKTQTLDTTNRCTVQYTAVQ